MLTMAVCIARIIYNRLERENEPSNEIEGLSFYDEELKKHIEQSHLEQDFSTYRNSGINDIVNEPAYFKYEGNIYHYRD